MQQDEYLIYNCVCENYFEYLQLLFESRMNDIGLVNGINKCDLEKTDGFTPFTKLIVSDHCNQQWLKLLLSFKNIDVNKRCQNKDYFEKHPLDLLQNDQWKALVVDKL